MKKGKSKLISLMLCVKMLQQAVHPAVRKVYFSPNLRLTYALAFTQSVSSEN